MKLAEAFARKTYKDPSYGDVMWTRNIPIVRGQLNNMSRSLAKLNIHVTPDELARNYRKEVEQYIDSIEEEVEMFVTDTAMDHFLMLRNELFADIFGRLKQ